jgi:hypothetical protein
MSDESERSFDGNEPKGEAETIRTQFDWASTAPSMAVIETVAIALDRELTTIEPLYESIDPDALDALLRSNGSLATANDVTVSFVVADRQVTVHSRGDVVVRPHSLE